MPCAFLPLHADAEQNRQPNNSRQQRQVRIARNTSRRLGRGRSSTARTLPGACAATRPVAHGDSGRATSQRLHGDVIRHRIEPQIPGHNPERGRSLRHGGSKQSRLQ